MISRERSAWVITREAPVVHLVVLVVGVGGRGVDAVVVVLAHEFRGRVRG